MRKKEFWYAVLLVAACLGLVIGSEAARMTPGGFSALPVVTEADIAAFPASSGTVALTVDGVLLPYDSASNTYFVPQDADNPVFDGGIAVEAREGWSYAVSPGGEVTKADAIARSVGYQVYALKGEEVRHSKALFTALPVVCITTATGDVPTETDGAGRVQIFTAENGRIRVTESDIEINLRGNTSKTLPKQSWRIKLLDADGDARKLSLAGLRVDDDWILNPMYTDASKVRETLAYEMWEQMNSSGSVAASSRVSYAEVFLNGEYWGLYGVQERVDRKQASVDKRAGVLYKVATNQRPTVEELLQCEDDLICQAFEVAYAGAGVKDVWAPAAAYMAAIEGSEAVEAAALDMQNVIDYGLWAMTVQAHDCHFKNQYLHAVYTRNGYRLYKMPWDLNNTLGDVYRLALTENNNTDFYVGSPVMDAAFEQLVNTGGAEVASAVQARWAELRESTITEEAVIARAEELYAAIAPAVARDGRRWPDSGYGDGNGDAESIAAFITSMLPRVDAYVYGLGVAEDATTQEEHSALTAEAEIARLAEIAGEALGK